MQLMEGEEVLEETEIKSRKKEERVEASEESNLENSG